MKEISRKLLIFRLKKTSWSFSIFRRKKKSTKSRENYRHFDWRNLVKIIDSTQLEKNIVVTHNRRERKNWRGPNWWRLLGSNQRMVGLGLEKSRKNYRFSDWKNLTKIVDFSTEESVISMDESVFGNDRSLHPLGKIKD